MVASDGVPPDDPTLYRELAGSLVYLTATRTDMSIYAPRTGRWATLVRIFLHFVRGTVFKSLLLSSTSSLQLRAFTHADWAYFLSQIDHWFLYLSW